MSQSTPEAILHRLDWHVVRKLDGLLQGDYRSIFYGSGLDLADLREYQPPDDIRMIDWNVTARMDTPYVRRYHEDREIMAWFLVDLSPSMDFGTVQTYKRNQLIDFVTVMARVLTRRGNRVGAILYSNKVTRIIPVQGGRLQVLRIVNELLREPKLDRAPMTDLKPLIDAGNHAIRRKSMVFVVSDFISAPGWERSLGLLAQRHEVIAVRLFDPRETDLPDIGLVVLEDSETGEQIFVDTHDKKFRQRFTATVEKREKELGAAFRRAGIDVLSLSTEDDLVQAVVRFAGARKQRVRQPSGAARM